MPLPASIDRHFSIVRRRLWSLFSVLLVAVILAGCGGGKGPTATPTAEPVASPTAAPTAIPALAIGDVVWAASLTSEGGPDDVLDSMPRDTKVVHAVVDVKNVPPGSTFTAIWTLNDSPLKGLDQTVKVNEESDQGWVAFTLTWNEDDLWPNGTLGVSITGPDGKPVVGTIEIAS